MTKKKTNEECIRDFRKIYGDYYDYSKFKNINAHTNSIMICPIHGEFERTPNDHMNGRGCPKCGEEKRRKSRLNKMDNVVKKANVVHNNKYDYSESVYDGEKKEMCIICPIHGKFWQRPDHHLNGSGCPICNSSKLEIEIRILLNNSNIEFIHQKKFEWLGLQSLDFYLPQYNIAIECQGIQHFKPIEYFGGIEGYRKNIRRDKLKYELCKEQNIKLFYISRESDLPSKYYDKIYTNDEELLNEIISYSKK